MNNQLIRWRLSQEDISRMSEYLHPIRSQEEVALMLDCSPELVGQLERSALRKVIRAMASLEPEEPRDFDNEE